MADELPSKLLSELRAHPKGPLRHSAFLTLSEEHPKESAEDEVQSLTVTEAAHELSMTPELLLLGVWALLEQ